MSELLLGSHQQIDKYLSGNRRLSSSSLCFKMLDDKDMPSPSLTSQAGSISGASASDLRRITRSAARRINEASNAASSPATQGTSTQPLSRNHSPKPLFFRKRNESPVPASPLHEQIQLSVRLLMTQMKFGPVVPFWKRSWDSAPPQCRLVYSDEQEQDMTQFILEEVCNL